MSRGVLWLLLCVNLGLAAGLAWFWVDERGQLRDFRWQRPLPMVPAAVVQIPRSLQPQADSERQFVAILERPLFAANRQPPQIKPVASVVDPLADLVLFGVYGGKDFGGVLARFDGKTRRVKLQDTIGDWTLTEIEPKQVTLTRASETRVIKLVQARVRAPVAPVAAGGAPATGAAPPGDEVARRQVIEETVRARAKAIEEERQQFLRQFPSGR